MLKGSRFNVSGTMLNALVYNPREIRARKLLLAGVSNKTRTAELSGIISGRACIYERINKEQCYRGRRPSESAYCLRFNYNAPEGAPGKKSL